MDNWYELERVLSNWLMSFSSEKLEFRNPNQAIVGFPSNGFRSDGMLTDGNILFAIEVEAGQMHPDTNVGKYWLLFDERKRYQKIILFHIYTPEFNSYEWRMKLGQFYAAKMKDVLPFEYRLFDFRKEQSLDNAVEILKTEMDRTIAQCFLRH